MENINIQLIQKYPEIQIITQIIEDYYFLERDDCHKKSCKREIVQARQMAMFFTKEFTKLSLNKIGMEIGLKDHATVMHACKTINNLIETDYKIRQDIEYLREEIRKKLITNIIEHVTISLTLKETQKKNNIYFATINKYLKSSDDKVLTLKFNTLKDAVNCYKVNEVDIVTINVIYEKIEPEKEYQLPGKLVECEL